MSVIDDLSFFQQVATRGSLTEVARQLGLSLPAVSKRLSQLEKRLGVQLLQRTTRRLSLTPEGTLYLEGGRPILRQLEELESALTSQQPTLQGRLRSNGTLGLGRRHLENPRILCASPKYLEHAAPLQQVTDLARHNCIVLRQFGSDYAIWRFHKDGEDFSHKVSGTLSSNDGEVAMSLALDGHGLILRSRWDVQEHLESGRLLAVLQDYQAPPGDIYAVYQHRRHIPQRISVFSHYLAQELARRLPFAVGH